MNICIYHSSHVIVLMHTNDCLVVSDEVGRAGNVPTLVRFTGLRHGIFQLHSLRIDGFVSHMRLDRPFLSLLVKFKFYA